MSGTLKIVKGLLGISAEQKSGIARYEGTATEKFSKGRAKEAAKLDARSKAIAGLCENDTDFYIQYGDGLVDSKMKCKEHKPGYTYTCKATLFVDPGKVKCIKLK